MKMYSLNYLVLLICLILTTEIATAQDKRLKVHAISAGVGYATSSSESAKSGLGLNFDFSTIVNRNIISFNMNTGLNLNSNGLNEEFTEWNLTYGRKSLLAQNLILEGHLGLGLFVYYIDDDAPYSFFNIAEHTIGFPFRAKLIYYPIENFGIGINPNLNLNSVATTFTANFIIQYNFN